MAMSALASPAMEKRATPTIYLAGDSTMANKGANDGATDGKTAALSLATLLLMRT